MKIRTIVAASALAATGVIGAVGQSASAGCGVTITADNDESTSLTVDWERQQVRTRTSALPGPWKRHRRASTRYIAARGARSAGRSRSTSAATSTGSTSSRSRMARAASGTSTTTRRAREAPGPATSPRSSTSRTDPHAGPALTERRPRRVNATKETTMKIKTLIAASALAATGVAGAASQSASAVCGVVLRSAQRRHEQRDGGLGRQRCQDPSGRRQSSARGRCSGPSRRRSLPERHDHRPRSRCPAPVSSTFGSTASRSNQGAVASYAALPGRRPLMTEDRTPHIHVA